MEKDKFGGVNYQNFAPSIYSRSPIVRKVKGYVFDIDGTLLKSDGKTLQKGVPELMKTVYKTKLPVMFVSGKNYAEVQSFLNILCKEANISRNDFKPVVASNGGSFVDLYDFRKPISAKKLEKINYIVNQIDPSSLIVYKTQSVNYVERARDAEYVSSKVRKAGVQILREVLVRTHKFDLPSVPVARWKTDDIALRNEVLSLNILSSKSKQLGKALEQAGLGLSVSPSGVYIDVSTSNKLERVQDFAQRNQINIMNIAAFGDSTNDEKILLSCGLAFLCNVKSKRYELFDKITSEPMKYAVDDLAHPELIKAITNKEYKESELCKETKRISERMKRPKESKKENVFTR